MGRGPGYFAKIALEWGPAYLLRSILCTIRFRMRGVKSTFVACEGLMPLVTNKGTFKAGKILLVRGRIVRSELGAVLPGAKLSIGQRVSIGQGVSIRAASYIEIGDDTRIGSFSAVLDTNWHGIDPGHPMRFDPVIIGDNVWLGRGVLVLPGSKIGDHSVLAAGSIVRGDIPPRVLAAGNPAQVVRELMVPDDKWRRS